MECQIRKSIFYKNYFSKCHFTVYYGNNMNNVDVRLTWRHTEVKYREKKNFWGDSGNKIVTEQCLYLNESIRLFHAGGSSTNERTFVSLYRCRGICRNGKYFWTGTALRQILFITAGTLMLQRYGKSARTIKKLPYARNLANWFSGRSLKLLQPQVIF